MWVAYFCMGAYKCDVVVIKVDAYIHGVLGGCLSRFYGTSGQEVCISKDLCCIVFCTIRARALKAGSILVLCYSWSNFLSTPAGDGFENSELL